VLEEESDTTVNKKQFSSHFELYQTAMHEVGADTTVIQKFVDSVRQDGVRQALLLPDLPSPSRDFTTITFDFIESGKPHEVAAALALGREHIIPTIFRSILNNIGVDDKQAPVFHFYLNKHIHLDEDFHAPLSLKLLEALCDKDAKKVSEAHQAAERAVQARLTFWDGVLKAIQDNKVRKVS
jgi:hypothetical protein